MGLIHRELDKLKDSDILSFILFALFKLKDAPEYSAISELSYILDKDNLFKLCEYFGGLTITIPTVEELETLLSALLLYKYIDIDRIEEEVATQKLSKNLNIRSVKTCYVKIRTLLTQYTFTARGKV